MVIVTVLIIVLVVVIILVIIIIIIIIDIIFITWWCTAANTTIRTINSSSVQNTLSWICFRNLSHTLITGRRFKKMCVLMRSLTLLLPLPLQSK